MKKLLFLAALMAVAMSVNAQWFDFSSNADRYGAGFNLGMAGVKTDYRDIGTGISLNVCGVYLDVLQAGPNHKYDNHIENKQYNDSTAFHINLGYQIPVLSWLRIAPMVGYCQTNAGITDASTININTDRDNGFDFYHDYDVTPGTRRHYFNAGVGLFVQPIRWVDIYAIGTLHAIYGGISINMGSIFGNY